MAEHYLHMTPEELLTKYEDGERDFECIILPYDSRLEGATLKRAHLTRVNLEGANLEGANLSGANLTYANLRGANFTYVNLEGANLEGANLIDANLRGIDLKGADLRGADLRGADLTEACLKNVKNLVHAINLEHALFSHTRVTKFEKRIIEKARKRLAPYTLVE